MKAKPRKRPVIRSIIRLASTTEPWAAKASCKSFSVVLKERFPTNNLLLIDDCCSSNRFSDCSRLSGFKSSLNHVHLKIFHVLKGQVPLTDGQMIPICPAVASKFSGWKRVSSQKMLERWPQSEKI